MSHVTLILSPCRMALGPMTHVEFKKVPCHPVDFRGQGPYPLRVDRDVMKCVIKTMQPTPLYRAPLPPCVSLPHCWSTPLLLIPHSELISQKKISNTANLISLTTSNSQFDGILLAEIISL